MLWSTFSNGKEVTGPVYWWIENWRITLAFLDLFVDSPFENNSLVSESESVGPVWESFDSVVFSSSSFWRLFGPTFRSESNS